MNAHTPTKIPRTGAGNTPDAPADPPDKSVAAETATDRMPEPGPVDADWGQHERAAEGKPPHPEGEDDDPYGDAETVKDEGVLESLGKAVSSPVKEAAEEGEARQGGAVPKPAGR